ncbi:MAG: response regulator transcription factor [Phycisphaerales bacterium]|nr:response regulator transcription factor [Phycisphaerales bacterium]
MNTIRILVVDDHALVRSMLADRLKREPGIEVTGAAGTADEAFDLVLKTSPDVVLMDIDMPGLICFDAARRMTAARPSTRILFLSAFTHDHYIEQALSVGALGYITKTEPPDVIVSAIRKVSENISYFSEAVRNRIVSDERGVRLAAQPQTRASKLTSREVEVVRYLARGLSKKEIAQVMHLSIKTVDKHTCNLMDKLDIHDRVELARFAIREGLAEP